MKTHTFNSQETLRKGDSNVFYTLKNKRTEETMTVEADTEADAIIFAEQEDPEFTLYRKEN